MVTSQDLPPKDGYGPVQWRRNLPSRGFRPSIYLAIMGAVSLVSLYPLFNGIKQRRELAREKAWARIHLLPVLQAEADRDAVRRYYNNLEREKAIMKGVPGWEDGKPVYSDEKIHTPRFVILDGAKNI
ncbi:GRIM-19 [Dipodascopsis uninucleata]